MLRFFTEYDESKPSLKDYMINGWRRKKWVEVSFRIGYEPEVSDTYKEWLKKRLTGALKYAHSGYGCRIQASNSASQAIR